MPAIIRIVLAGILSLAVCAHAAATAADHDFSIPAQPVGKALVAFAVQSNVSITYPDENLEAIRGNAVTGRYSSQQALSRILSGTGLAFDFIDADTVRIFRERATAVPRVDVVATMESVTVTGTKRNILLQDLATSAAVIQADSLTEAGVVSTDDLGSFIAAFTTTNLGPGRNKIFLRGLSDGSFNSRIQSVVGIYLDDTPINFSAPDPDIQLIDIDRVEVLRGPQGSLYGSGAIGGIYRIVTRRPDLTDFGGWAAARGSLTQGGGDGGSIEGAVNVPLVTDHLGLRIAGYRDLNGGYIDDTRLGERNINGSDISGLRAMLRWAPDDRWTVDLAGTFQSIDQDDSQYYTREAGRFLRQNFVHQPYHDDIAIGSLTVHADLDWAELTSSTSLIGRDVSMQSDATLSVPRFVSLGNIPSPFLALRRIDMISHESRLVSPDSGPFRWLVGASLLRNRERDGATLTVPGAGDVFAGQGFPSDVVYSEARREAATESALFGELEWYVTDAFSVTAGARLFHNTTSATASTDGIAGAGLPAVEGRRRQTDVMPKAVVSYRADEDLLIYIRAEEGFRMGGININTPANAMANDPHDPATNPAGFDPDRLWTFDLGVKSTWLQGRLRANLALFYVIWQDIQTEQLLPDGLSFVTNAGNGHNVGFEMELAARPLENLEIAANLLLNTPELGYLNPALGLSPSESRLPGVANMTVGVNVAYSFTMMAGFFGRVGFNYAYTGHSLLLFDRLISPVMGDYHYGNLVLSATRGQVTAGVTVDNIWNTGGNSFAYGNPFSLPYEHQVTPLRPRTVGLFVNYQF